MTEPNIRSLLLDYRRALDVVVPAEAVQEELHQKEQQLLERIRHEGETLLEVEQSFRDIAVLRPGSALLPNDLAEIVNRYRDAHREHGRLLEAARKTKRAAEAAADDLEIKLELLREAKTALLDYIGRCPVEEIDSLARVIDLRPPAEDLNQEEPEGHPS